MLPSYQTTEYITCPYTACAHPTYYTPVVSIAYSIQHYFLSSVPTTYLSRSTQTLRALAVASHEGDNKLWTFSSSQPSNDTSQCRRSSFGPPPALESSHPPLGKLSKMALVVPSFNTPLHTQCSPPPPLAEKSSSVGHALAPHSLAPRWLHP